MVATRPKHTKKKMTILFFVYFGTHNNKIHTIYKQTSIFVLILSSCCFAFISKAATTKNRQYALLGQQFGQNFS
jgi:hypothetical protein